MEGELLMAILQLNPALPIWVESYAACPGGNGLAHLVIDDGQESNLKWVVFLDESMQCWTVANHHIRAQTNITLDRIRNCS